MRLLNGDQAPIQAPGYDYMDFVPLRVVDDLRQAYITSNRWRLACVIAWAGLVALTVAYWMGGGP